MQLEMVGLPMPTGRPGVERRRPGLASAIGGRLTRGTFEFLRNTSRLTPGADCARFGGALCGEKRCLIAR
jgi:hypothetical protein